MSPDQMKSALLRIVDEVEAAAQAKHKSRVKTAGSNEEFLAREADHVLRQAVAEAVRMRKDIPGWVDDLHAAKLKVSKPKVMRVRGQYGSDMAVVEDGLYVSAQVVIVARTRKARVFEMKELVGWAPLNSRVRIPLLGMQFFLGRDAEALLEKEPALLSAIYRLTEPLVAEARAAFEDAKRQAPALVRAFQAPNLKDEESVMAEKLSPFLKDNPLAALHPAALTLIFKTPWEELEKLVSFLKGNRALAGGVTEESMEHILQLMVAQEVMRS